MFWFAELSDPQTVILTSFVGIIVAVCAPLLLVYLTGRQHEKDKQQDYDRQDLVAARLKASNEAAEKRAIEAAKRLEKVADTVDVVHTLVNSDKTAAMQRELDDKELALVLLKEVNRLQSVSGVDSTPESLAAIAGTEKKIAQLKAELEERHRQNEMAEIQIKESLAKEQAQE